MKKLFTLTLAAALTMTASTTAQTLRKTWDFREGFSTKTINALKGDQEEFGDSKYWRNFESDATKADEKHFWNASGDFKNADKQACTHAGGKETVIPELEGLTLGATAAKKFVITYAGDTKDGYEDSPNGKHPYGPSYVWLNGKNETISFQAEVGQKIRIGVESHSNSQDRGIALTTSAGNLELLEGKPTPTFFNECVWDLTGDPGTVATLQIKSTNGCHIYYIIVGDGDDPNANKTQVGYIAAGDATAEPVYQMLTANTSYNVTAIEAGTLAASQLEGYSAVVISPELPADNAAVEVLKEALPFYPILNLNAGLYAAWGYGEAVMAEQPIVLINDLKSDLLADFTADVDYQATEEGNIVVLNEGTPYTGVKPGDYFAGDLAPLTDPTDETLLPAHIHNIYHNAYIYLPYAADMTGATRKLIENAIDVLKSSKSPVEQASAPKISLEYKHLNTNITIGMASSNFVKPHIYYTLDGTEPTAQSTEYTGTINVAAETTVKAVAIAEGYLLSSVAETKAGIFSQPATPAIATDYEDGQTIVTLTCDTDGADIWYNFAEGTDTTKSMKYSEPIVVTLPTALTAFSVTGGQVFSEPATQRVVVSNVVVRQDLIGLFDANAADYQNGGGSTVYYFSWGKTAQSIYDTTQEPTVTTDPETGDEITVYPERDYEYYVPATQEDGTEAQWEVKSKGQVMIWQSLTAGSDPGNDSGYNPETSGDILSYAKITSNDIQFGGKASGESCSGAIQSRVRFQAPFDVVTIVGTAAGGDNVGRIQLQVSADSLEWTNVGDEMTTSTVKRLWKTYTRSYNGQDEVYVRVVQAGGGSSIQIYNIYILNEGETSKALKAQYEEEFATGVQNVRTAAPVSGVYSLNGQRLSGLQRGLNIVVEDGQARKVLVK